MSPDDLTRVGPDKPLGYLPLDTLDDPDGLKCMLESRGLEVLVLDEAASHVRSGAMVAYDHRALGELLRAGSCVLENSGWPVDARAFALYQMTHNAPFRTALYDLVADAYADYGNPYRTDKPQTRSRGSKFGCLRSCCSCLF